MTTARLPRSAFVTAAMLVAVAALAFPRPAAAQTVYTWANSNISGSGSTSLNWFNPTQGTWGGGTPVQDDPATVIQFFSGTTTNLANTGALTQTTVIDGTSAFQLSTLQLLGWGPTVNSSAVSMIVSGSALNFAATTGTIQFNSRTGGSNGSSPVNHRIAAPIQLGSAGSASVLTIDAIGSNNAPGAAGTGGYRIDGVISELGTGSSLVKTGANTVYLSGSNTFTGGVTINGGVLSVGVNSSGTSAGTVLGTGPLTINAGTFEANGNASGVASQTIGSLTGSAAAVVAFNNRSLTFGSLNTNTIYAGSINNGTLIKVGTGTTTLFSAGSTVTGATVTVSGGGIKLGASKNFTSGRLEGTLELDGFSTTSSLGNTGLNFSLLTGSGTFTNASQQLFFGSDIAGSGTGTIRGNYVMASNPNFRAGNQAGTKLLVIDGVLGGGAGSIINSGNGFTATLRLTGSLSNTFTGTWAMSAGTTELAKTGGAIAIPTDVTLTSGILRWQASDQIADTSNISAVNAATLNLNGYNETVATFTSGTSSSWTNTSTSGTLFLSGTTANVLSIAQGGNSTGKTLTMNFGITGTVGGGISMDAGTSTSNQNMRIGTAAGQVTLDLGPVSRTVTVTDNTSMAIDAQIYSTITGSGGLIKAGAGVLQLYGNNTFSGTTRIDAGTLDLNANGLALQNSVVDLGGSGTLSNYGTTPMFGGLVNYSGFTLANNVTRLTINVLAGGTQTYSTLPAGGASTIGFSKAGPGRLIFTGTSTWTGATGIDGGILEVSSLPAAGTASPLGSGTTITFGSGSSTGTLLYTGTGQTSNRAFQLAGTTGGGGIESNGTGPLVFTGTVSTTGVGSKVFTLGGSNTGTNSIGPINGTDVSVTKTGAGTWQLTGASSYSGRLTVLDGTVTAAWIEDGNNTPFGSNSFINNLPLIGNSAAGASGTAALLIQSGSVTRGMFVAESNGSQVVVIGGSGPGTAVFNTSSIRLGRSVTLQASTGGTVEFNSDWLDVTGGTNPAVAFNVGSPDNAGTVALKSFVPDSITGVNVRRGTLRLDYQLGSTLGYATPVTLGETGAGGTLVVNAVDQPLASLSFAGVGSTASATGGSVLRLFNGGTSNASVNVTGMGHALSAPTALDDPATFMVDAGGSLLVSGPIGTGSSGAKTLTKSGLGILEFSGTSSYSGTTSVAAGSLRVNGRLANSNVTVQSGGMLGGSGVLGGSLTGDGLIAPGNSPGILTVEGQLTPTGSTSFAFEFSGTGSPTWSNASASVNDVLRLTNADPFTSGLGSGNVVNIYFDVESLAAGNTFLGGFFTDNGGYALETDLANATYAYFVKGNGGGLNPYNGTSYYTLAQYMVANPSVTGVTRSVVPAGSTNFADGTISTGQVTQFVIIPEPGAIVLAAIGIAAAAYAARRRRPL